MFISFIFFFQFAHFFSAFKHLNRAPQSAGLPRNFKDLKTAFYLFNSERHRLKFPINSTTWCQLKQGHNKAIYSFYCHFLWPSLSKFSSPRPVTTSKFIIFFPFPQPPSGAGTGLLPFSLSCVSSHPALKFQHSQRPPQNAQQRWHPHFL